MKTCLNCGEPLKGAFCHVCGQKASTRQINWQAFLEELPKSLFNLEHGFWYTLKELTLRTRSTVDGYLSGKRVLLFKPIQYAILGITLYTLLQTFNPLDPPTAVEGLREEKELYSTGYAVGELIGENLKF